MEDSTEVTIDERTIGRLESKLETHIESEEILLTTVLETLRRMTEQLTAIRVDIAGHEERSHSQSNRIERIEKAGGAITLTLMAALLAVFLSGCSLFAGLKPPPAAAPEPPKVDVVARGVNNTVALRMIGGAVYCSGVVAEGTIYTAAHCVPDGHLFTVWYKSQDFPGVVVSVDRTSDLAIVDAIGARIKDSVPFSETMPKLGNKVVWMGYPLGQDFIMGTGIVGNPSVPVEGSAARFMAIDGQFIPGNSGGPVFNYKGELIGIVSMTMYHPSTGVLPVGYAVPLDVLRATLS